VNWASRCPHGKQEAYYQRTHPYRQWVSGYDLFVSAATVLPVARSNCLMFYVKTLRTLVPRETGDLSPSVQAWNVVAGRWRRRRKQQSYAVKDAPGTEPVAYPATDTVREGSTVSVVAVRRRGDIDCTA
jgi:hypothetical protein